ncbi:hypothetical protein [Hydrogenimonas sp.]
MLKSLTKKKRSDGMTVTSMEFSGPSTATGYYAVENPVLSPMSRSAQERVMDGGSQYRARVNKPVQFKGGYYSDLANTALQNVFNKNLLKSRMAENRILGNLAATKMQTDTQRANTQLRTGTRYRIAQMNDKTANRRIDVTGKYYQDTIDTNRRGQDLRYRANLARTEASRAPKPVNPLDEMIKRRKAVLDAETFKRMLPPEISDEISDDNLGRAYMEYVQTGKVPSFKKEEGFWDTDYAPVTAGAAHPNAESVSEVPDIAKGIEQYTGRGIVAQKIIDGKHYFKLDNGTWVTY